MPLHVEIGGRVAGGSDADFVKPVPPGEELRLPTTVVPYLLPIVPKKGKNGTTQTSTQDSTKPQFVGPQGYVLPKQQQ